MKTLRNKFDELISFENLWWAYGKARRGKRYDTPAANFDQRAEERILTLQQELRNGTYRPGVSHHFYIHEPKLRKISAAPFRDRVVHHALVNVLEPFYEARFSSASFACRKGKGTHAALDRAHWGVRNCRWLLKGDVVKFFPCVDHEVLRGILWRHVADAKVRQIVALILDSGRDVLADEREPAWFAGDDLLTPVERPCGLPIGNLTSQFFANVLLNELDQFVHREIQPREYVRYSDDFVLFDDDPAKLQAALRRLSEFLARLRLRLHSRKTCIRPCSQGLAFLGFRLTSVTRRVGRAGLSRFRKRMRRWQESRVVGQGMAPRRITASIRGWLAHVAHANSHALVREIMSDVRV